MKTNRTLDNHKLIKYRGLVSDIANNTGLSVPAVWQYVHNNVGGDSVIEKITEFINSPYYLEKEKQLSQANQTSDQWKAMQYHGCIKDIMEYTGLSHYVISQAIKKGIVNDIDVTLKINSFFAQVNLVEKMKPKDYIEYMQRNSK